MILYLSYHKYKSFLEKDEYEKGKEYISEMLMGISQISKASYDVRMRL